MDFPITIKTPYACFTDSDGVLQVLGQNPYWKERKQRLRDEWIAMMKCIADAYERKVAEMTKDINPVYLTFTQILCMPRRYGCTARAIRFSNPVPIISVRLPDVTFPDGSVKEISLAPAYTIDDGRREGIVEIVSSKGTAKLEDARERYDKTGNVSVWKRVIILEGTEDIDAEGTQIINEAILKHVMKENETVNTWLQELNEITEKEQ